MQTEIYIDTVSNEKLNKEFSYYINGSIKYEEYKMNDQLHREDGPSWVYYYENGNIDQKSYWVRGNLHRDNGPAIVRYTEDGIIDSKEYWIKGKQIRDDLQIFLLETLEMELENGI